MTRERTPGSSGKREPGGQTGEDGASLMGSSWGRGRGKERREVARDSVTASRQRNCRRRETWEGLKAPRHPRVGGRTMKKDVHRVVYGVNVAYEGRRRQSGASS